MVGERKDAKKLLKNSTPVSRVIRWEGSVVGIRDDNSIIFFNAFQIFTAKF